MNIWLSPMGAACKVGAASRDDADLLRGQLMDRGANCAEPVNLAGEFGCIFYVKRPSKRDELERLLKDIPDVELMVGTA